MKLAELADRIQATLTGDGEVDVTSCAGMDDAGPAQVTFLSNPRYQKKIETTRAAAVIVGLDVTTTRSDLVLLRARDPYFAFRNAAVALHGFRRHPFAGIHPSAFVEPTARVGENSVLYPGVYVGAGATIGRDCILYSNVVVYDGCVIGDRVILHAGCSIGQDGFGHATHKGEHHKIPQTGNTVIEDDVELGANCAIDRAALGSTVIGKGSKFGNLINIGHGSKVGAHALFVGLNGVAGSTTLGHHCTLGGQTSVAGHLKIGDYVSVGSQSGVYSNLADKAAYLGNPAMPIARGRRCMMLATQLPDIFDRLRALEKRVKNTAETGPDAAGETTQKE